MTPARWVDLGLGIAVAAFGLWRTTGVLYYDPTVPVLIALLMGVAVASFRVAPAVGLGLVWLTGIMQVLRGLDIALVQLAAVLVAYGAARYGRTVTVWASGLSIPLGASVALLYASYQGTAVIQESGLWQLLGIATSATDLGYNSPAILGLGFVLATALLAGPWALGLVLRLRARAREATDARERAQQLASAREEQARLARDVHDVVGHSLAVIVAQADSAQSLGDDEIARIREAMASIAQSARASLRDVRDVLAEGMRDAGPPPDRTDLDSLIEGVRSAGTPVASGVTGAARPLPPDLALVAYRTLQEMLTNALKHGRAGDEIVVDLDWQSDRLIITVRNPAAGPVDGSGGSGVEGMRARLASVGGELDAALVGDRFVASASMPLRARGAA
ncbi:histidine kinase [Leifsonia sp. H3M29-4]|uniref:sensor histidine kinase n=1 Tax=Salinibacterium metalliresistens TaxID=3031321 RepID=UPI0023DA89DA|nr:histidine kinase [Salinibacterium metalliresistens]MDF1477793.1 histidine kinase [Salinibacterium metalliresistens]